MAMHIKALRLSKLTESVMAGPSSTGIADEDDETLDIAPIANTTASIRNTASIRTPSTPEASNDDSTSTSTRM